MRSFESREDYLEAILVLQNEKGAVRSIDIAAKLGFTKPSVSRAMGLLRGAEYITVDRDGFIRLTETGRAAAESVYEPDSFGCLARDSGRGRLPCGACHQCGEL